MVIVPSFAPKQEISTTISFVIVTPDGSRMFTESLKLVPQLSLTVTAAKPADNPVADELAAAASLLMGQADQKKPIVLIRGYKFNFSTSSNGKDLIRSEEEDLFR